jgi:hypothetical protein
LEGASKQEAIAVRCKRRFLFQVQRRTSTSNKQQSNETNELQAAPGDLDKLCSVLSQFRSSCFSSLASSYPLLEVKLCIDSERHHGPTDTSRQQQQSWRSLQASDTRDGASLHFI